MLKSKQVISLFYVRTQIMFESIPNMKNNLAAFITFLFLITATSCNETGFIKKQFVFYYYPSKNVYYNVANNQYTYSVDGGRTWYSFKPTSNTEAATLGGKQIINSDNEQPWNINEIHRKQYNGTLISVADADSIAQPDVVSDKKIITKKPKLNVEEPPKKEKKPGFFKRLFGGGKKHKSDQQNEQ